jgi:acylphosphatase
MMVGFVKQGPARAKVSSMDLVWEEYKGEFRHFTVKY